VRALNPAQGGGLVNADETLPERLDDLDTGFTFDPTDPLASIRDVEDFDLDKRVAAVGNAVRDMAAAGVLDAVTEATVKDYVIRRKLLPPAAVNAIVREARPRPAKSPAAQTAKRAPEDEHSARAAFMALGGDLSGSELLDEVEAFMGKYLVFPDEHCRPVVVLWAAHTHATSAFYVTPRLILDSAEPESGKTRVLELLALFCHRPKMTFNTTVAALYRRLLDSMLTLLLDEADAIWSAKAGVQAEELRAFVNAGYKRGATVDRCVGEGSNMQVVEFPVFAPVAIAGIAGNLPRTVVTRGVTIHMRRRAPGEGVHPYEEQDVVPAAEPLREQLARWAATVERDLRAARPAMPPGVVDRKAEVWRALLAVADAAGGKWPERARAACEHFALGTEAASASLGMRLLADVKQIFGAKDRMKTTEILAELIRREEAPWGDMRGGKPLDARKLADLLRRYEVGPTAFDVLDGTGKTAKGYTTYPTPGNGGLYDAWLRYLPPDPGEGGEDGEDGKSAGQSRDGTDVLTGNSVRGATDPDRLTDLSVSDVFAEGHLTCEVTELTALTGNSGLVDSTSTCPDCGSEENSIIHAVSCLGEDPAA
jgi:hypothetical protein